MREALQLASRVPRRPWPNPPVGALLVSSDGRVLGRGAHRGPGTPHAEVVALDEAGAEARGATLYCTLEPCNHQGRTPPCSLRVASSGIRRLVVAVRDPNPTVAGGGLEVVRRAGIDVTLGVAAAEALELIWPFVVTGAFTRPYVLLKTAASLDARFAPPRDPGVTGPAYLTALEARRDVHRLRRWADLVLVGSRTILADRPTLDGRLVGQDGECPAQEPSPGYVDTDMSVHAEWPGRTHFVFGGRESTTPERLAEVERAGGRAVLCDERDGLLEPASVVASLAGLGVHAVLIEGGPTLAHSFLVAGLVDRWVSFVAPIVLGTGPTWPSPAAEPAAWSTSARSISVAAPVALRPPTVPVEGRPAASLAGAAADARFHLTRCSSAGADVRMVHDRLSFAETLARLTTEGKD
jgi:diaminohydroxyphosphoribosylaminopyrimidine deaminase/5-amino-6-(5-phosphoribosylamino)uracil reductase